MEKHHHARQEKMEILRMKPQRKEIKQVIHGVALKYIAFEIDLEIAKFHLLCRYCYVFICDHQTR